MGGQDHIAVVGEDENGFCVDLPEGIQEITRGGIHALPAVYDLVHTHGEQGVFHPFSSGNADQGKFFLFLRLGHFKPVFNGDFAMLQGHVFDFQRKEFPVLLAVVENFSGVHGVNMHFNHTAFGKSHHRFSVIVQPPEELFRVKMRHIHLAILQLKKKFGTIAELQYTVLVETGGVHFLRRSRIRRSSPGYRHFAGKSVLHALGNVEKSGSAAVHHAGLLENIQ